MSTGYKITDKEDLYYLTFQVVGCIDVFTSKIYKDIVIERFKYCQEYKELNIFYGTNQERIKSVYKENGNPVKTKYFLGSYEKEINHATNIEKEINYVDSPNGLIAVNIKEGTQTGTTYYVCKDHLGSITALLNQDGNKVEEYSYNAWGIRRNPNTWTYDSVTTPTLLDRGYTGHEHLDQFGLINMNGRMYDPAIGQMLSPDNYIQNPNNTQNYNRYSYCLNNPLKYTDPSGNYCFFILPNIGWSPNGGLSLGVTGGIGFYGGASAQVGISYEFKSKNFSVSAGASLMFENVYAGWGSKSGSFTGANIGFGNWNGISSNITSMGISNSQYGGSSANISFISFNDDGISVDPSIEYSHTFYISPSKRYVARTLNCSTSELSDPVEVSEKNARDIINSIGDTPGLSEIFVNGKGVNKDILYNSGTYEGSMGEGDGLTYAITNTKQSNIYVSKNAFKSKYNLYLTMGHERVHVMDYYYGRWEPTSLSSTEKSDLRAYRWMLYQCLKANSCIASPYYGIWMGSTRSQKLDQLRKMYGDIKMYDY